jgi:hypothetical protein
MNPPWKVAIDKLTQLFKENTSPDCWADNLIKASAHLKDKRDWTLFYSYITNPRDFDPNQEIKTLEDMEILPKIPDYESCLEVHTYNNGPREVRIHVKNPSLYTEEKDDSDDEKCFVSIDKSNEPVD